MKLKRIFADGEKSVQDCMVEVDIERVDARGNGYVQVERQFNHLAYREAGGVISVEIQRLSEAWNVSQRVVDKGLSEGWASMTKGQFILHTPGEDVAFNVVAPPNREQARNYYELKVA